MAKKHGHYCWVCETYKANEKFSGKGHKIHICKKCAQMQRAERRAKAKQKHAVEANEDMEEEQNKISEKERY